MQLIGVARLGRDAEVKTVKDTTVANMSLAFNYGQKGSDGKQPTQWVKAALWGKLAEVLADYLIKGREVQVTLDDVHVETYEGQNGTGYNLAGRVLTLKLVGGKPEGQTQQGGQQRSAAPAPAPRPAPASSAGYDDDDTEIPF